MKKIKKNLKCSKRIIFILFISLISIMFITISKYVEEHTGVFGTKVAIPIIEVLTSDESIDIEESTTEYTKTFNIMNYNNTNINESKLKYYLEFDYTDIDSDQMEIILTRNNENVTITDNITEEFSLKVDAKQTDEFILKINSKEVNEDELGNIKVKLHSYQVNPKGSD